MNLKNLPAGKNIPEDIYVIIEISAHSYPIKYEMNKDNGIMFVNRFIPTSMIYPCNYGYINNTLSLDNDPLDVIIPISYAIYPGSVLLCRPIGMLKMVDESGEDNKIIAIPHNTISQEYQNIKDISDLSSYTKDRISHFFKHYKDLESNKWIQVKNWTNKTSAKEEILLSFNRAKSIKKTQL